MLNAKLFTVAKVWKQSKCPLIIDEWIKNMWYAHTCTHTQRNISQP